MADGCSLVEAAQRFSVSERTLARWIQRQRTTASLAPTTGRCGRPRRLTAAHDLLLRDRIDAVPDATIDELQAWLAADHGISVGHGTVWRAIARIDRTRKKRA